MAIKPLTVSANAHMVSVFRNVLTTNTTAWITAKVFQAVFPNKYSAHRIPYSPQPIIVAKAKQHKNSEMGMLTQLP